MALEVFKLFGSVMVNNDEANKSIAKTTDNAEGLGSKLVSGAGTALKFGAAIGTAAIAGGAALVGLANKAVESTDRIDKLSNKIGISKQGFQEWDYVLGQNGMDVEKLQVGVKTLVTQMDAAAGGSKKATAAFGKLGVSWQDGNGKLKSQEVMMNESIMALANMENGTEKARLATELFGKAGTEMMPMLNNGAEGITDLKDRAHELGLVLSDEAVTSGVVLGDTMDDVKTSFGAVATKIGVQVMPLVQKALDWLLDKMPVIQSVLGKVFDGISLFVEVFVSVISDLYVAFNENFGWIIDVVANFISGFGTSIGEGGSIIDTFVKYAEELFGSDFADTIKSIIEMFQTVWDNSGPIFEGLKTIFATFIDYIQVAWESIGKPIFNFFIVIIGKLAEVFTYVFPYIATIFGGLCDTLSLLWEQVLKPIFQAVGDFIKNFLLPVFSVVFDLIAEYVMYAFSFIGKLWTNSLKPILDGIIMFIGGIFSGNWSQVWQSIISIITGLWEGIKTIIWSPIEWITDKLSGLADIIIAPFKSAIDSIGNIWSAIKSVFKLPHFNFKGSMNPLDWIDEGMPSIGVEWYAKGGIMNRPTMFGMNGDNAMVGGEAGPEAIAPISTLMDYIRTAVSESNDTKGQERNLIIKIENFINNRQQDVEAFAEELQFYMKQKAVGGGN